MMPPRTLMEAKPRIDKLENYVELLWIGELPFNQLEPFPITPC
jgi:hypothetical protein